MSALGTSIIDPKLRYFTFQCETNEILTIYVQPLDNGMTNIEMYNREEKCPVRSATESDAAAAFRTFYEYMKWMD